ncbi:hypothetical protein V9T40_006121 [Parthenolecanium corni]|uniref:ADAMTS-like protein 1 n=1 Tax=Parthenolecanium corni TaxID=536013 RepID=A0AAN9TTS6_9HEMI
MFLRAQDSVAVTTKEMRESLKVVQQYLQRTTIGDDVFDDLPCSDNADFRETQCSMFNEFSETAKLWKAYYHPEESCALYCVDQIGNIEMQAPKVQDGTRCRPGSLDMCIDGRCHPVGCDLEIGSLKTVDSCGVCGGDGKTCALPLYQWNENTNTTCSVKCGGGYKVSQPICQNTVVEDVVDQQLCDISQMPQVKLLECNPEPCPPKWEAGEWSACSHSCGSGIKTRRVYCIEEQNKTKTKVFSHFCKGHKPRMQESCNMQPCPPEWIAGQWSQCSASCGQGTQTRTLTCNKNPSDTMECDPTKKPPSEQKCIGDMCQDKYYPQYDEEPRMSPVTYKEPELIQAEKLIDKQPISTHAVFVAEEWGPCSVTCGEGVRRRKVYCKAHLDYTKIMTKFTDDTCSGKKPDEEEPCKLKACASDSGWEVSAFGDESLTSPRVAPGAYGKTYSWVKHGYTPCTATCLGGVQELIVSCIRNEDKKVVSPYLCDTKTQPPLITQTCNDHPCPPRWNVSEYFPCSKKCGMGIQTREVNCIHEVTPSNTVIVPHSMCEQPPPLDRQHCNIVDCPVEWHMSNWTKCSKRCGGGVKSREVRCHQIKAQNHDISHPDHVCEAPKPHTQQPCNTRPCDSNKKSNSEIVLGSDSQFYNQSDPQSVEVSLRIGGQAVVFAGTRVKIKCPVQKSFPRERIIWLKGGSELFNKGKYKISKKGILRIMEATGQDNTTFTCKAGQSTATIRIYVKPSPGRFPPDSEEYTRQQSIQPDPERTMEYSGNLKFEPSEDMSHERSPDSEKKQKMKKKISSTPSYLPPVGATTDEGLTNNQGTKQENPNPLLPSTSSGSRLTPFLFSFFVMFKNLWSFQESHNIRNQRMLSEEPAVLEELKQMPENSTTTESIFGTTVILGKGDRNSVKFEWLITQWSNCSPPCGGTGFQIRAAHCMVKLNNVTQNVENNLCEDAGLPIPNTIQKCETNDCPHWIVNDWQACNSSRCFAWNTAMQKRDVLCQAPNGTLVPDAWCEASEKPTTKQECYNDLCKGTWRVGEWTECYAPCDKDGVKYRILQCVWYGTKKPAGTACRDQPRPSVMRTCKGAPCAGANGCRDLSKYCQNVKALNMCKLRRYKVQCCHSCKEE